MESRSNTQTTKHLNYWILIAIAFLTIALLAITMFIGHREWEKQTDLTQAFESCMQSAPFQNSFEPEKLEKTIKPEDLQTHLKQFNQIFDETGLPPIWDGNKLVPWREYHRESIQVAKRCHEEMGITRPQQQLRGSYAKPVWDPGSQIWQSHQPTT